MEDNRRPKLIMKWVPEGRRRRGLTEAKWETEVEGISKKGNLTTNDAINRQLQ